MAIKANCYNCAHRRRKKDFVQQKNCGLNLDPKGCKSFVDYTEWQKYKAMMEGK